MDVLLDKLKSACPTSSVWNPSGDSIPSFTDNEQEALKLIHIVYAPELGIRSFFDMDTSNAQFADHCSEYAGHQKIA